MQGILLSILSSKKVRKESTSTEIMLAVELLENEEVLLLESGELIIVRYV